jgi:hypothetical protein
VDHVYELTGDTLIIWAGAGSLSNPRIRQGFPGAGGHPSLPCSRSLAAGGRTSRRLILNDPEAEDRCAMNGPSGVMRSSARSPNQGMMCSRNNIAYSYGYAALGADPRPSGSHTRRT